MFIYWAVMSDGTGSDFCLKHIVQFGLPAAAAVCTVRAHKGERVLG